MIKNFQQRLIFSFLLIFAISMLGIVIFERQQEREHRNNALLEKLDTYAEMIAKATAVGEAYSDCPSCELLPYNLRITLIDRNGNVYYDNVISGAAGNHLDRPEIVDAMKNNSGYSIRESATNKTPYIYYAKIINDKIIRVALPYDEHIKFLLQTNKEFLFFAIVIFIMGLMFIMYVGNYFGKTVKRLKDFSKVLEIEGVNIPKFSEDEFGKICINIAENLRKIKENETLLAREKEKLLMHVQASVEGVCFFNADQTVAFYNGLFLQYFNIISSQPLTVGKKIEYISNLGVTEDYFETHINKQGRRFSLRMNVFEDKSFEVILIDVTAADNARRLKQEMTGNIAHELRTPVTSIHGFLEILLENNISEEKHKEYLQRAFSQTKVLSELISDMSLLAKIDAKAESFELNKVNISGVITSVCRDYSQALQEKNIKFISEIPENCEIEGNHNLIHSIFRNLTENVIRHSGGNVDINVKLFEVKNGKAYFIFSDNGKGLDDEQHLSRLFERFYRVHDGRTRSTGGSGLGLSIVKNAVLFHNGTISVKMGEGGKGLEFLFSLEVGM
ncbi:MAG: ATP-binding protein [Fibromonadales bacterium]|nr:ATP-binding protein [Fibromonadales bacterium]